MLVAKRIIRLATPPWVRKLPARMENGIAMISNFSMPVKSLSATLSINKLIADELTIAVRTVEVHRARVFAKLGVRSAAEVATLLERYGGRP